MTAATKSFHHLFSIFPPRGLCFHPCVFVGLVVGLLAELHKSLTGLHETLREDGPR